MDPKAIFNLVVMILYVALGVTVIGVAGYILVTRAGREALRMGVTNLRRSPMRTLLTMLGIVIGVGAVVSVISMGDGAKEMVSTEVARNGGTTIIEVFRDEWDQQGGSTITSRSRARRGQWRRNRAKPIMYADYRNMSMMLTDVVAVSAEDDYSRGVMMRHGDREKEGALVGATPGFMEAYNWRPTMGRFLSQEDDETAATVAVLGSEMASYLFGGLDPTGAEIRVQRMWGRNQEAVRLRVVGVMEPRGATSATEGWDDKVLMPLSAFHSRITGRDDVERLRVKAVDLASVPNVVQQIRAVLARRHQDADAFSYWTASQEIATAERLGTILKLLMGVVAGIALLVAGIGIMNIMLVSVTERTQEIGLRKALGAKRRDVLFQFLIETSVLSLVGGIFGAGLGVLLGRASAVLLEKYVLSGAAWPSVMSPTAIVVAVSIAFVVGVLSGVYPASRAAKLTPVEALRVE